MANRCQVISSCLAITLTMAGSLVSAAPPAASVDGTVVRFLQTNCVKCHDADKQKGDVRLDDLTADMARDGERWALVADQLRDGTMPPKKEPRPDEAASQQVVAWIASAGDGRVARLPNQGNLIPHEALFGKPASVADAPAARVWRLSPDAYLGMVRDLSRGRPSGVVQPFTLIPERGVRDYSSLYTIDEQSTAVLLRNAEAIVESQTAHAFKDGKLSGKNDSVREFVQLMDPASAPTRQQLEAAIQKQFKMAIDRVAAAEDVDRLIGLYEKCAKAGDHPGAAKTMLQAILLRTDALYRSEIGEGKADRRLLAPLELARAISLALGDRREPGVIQAAEKGELITREQVAAQVRRILNDPKIEKPRLLRFFREYFEYNKATDVFKEKPVGLKHAPEILVSDTDRLVLHILDGDRDVFRKLLTTPESFVNYSIRKNKKTRMEEPQQAVQPNKPDKNGKGAQFAPDHVYGFAEWPEAQPVKLPADTRLGIMMQPSWLVAWSTNFDNDVVRRGRWIRERLLGGTVPDLPIGVVAQVPDERHRTFRDRLTVTREERCWKCHQRMDDLGLPFENFDHYGEFRRDEKVLDPDATTRNVDSKGKPLGQVLRGVALDTTGLIAGSGDPILDGPVKDPRELVLRLANSDRVRQVFIRHVFRYFMGRNESLADAATLQAADRAYLESGGSFKTLVVSILTSDSFLYRSTAVVAGLPSKGAPQ